MKALAKISLIFLFTVFINAQTLNIHTHDGSVYQIEIASIDSITFQETTAVTQSIDGTVGGIISYDRGIFNTEGKVVNVNARLEIPANAFPDIRNITMTVNADSGLISFSPSLNFSSPCVLNFGLINLDLAKLGFSSADVTANFVYFGDDGSISPVQNQGVTFDFGNGVLEVKMAKIDHFSRYGFVR